MGWFDKEGKPIPFPGAHAYSHNDWDNVIVYKKPSISAEGGSTPPEQCLHKSALALTYPAHVKHLCLKCWQVIHVESVAAQGGEEDG